MRQDTRSSSLQMNRVCLLKKCSTRSVASCCCVLCDTLIIQNGSFGEKFYSNITICLCVASKRLCFQFHGLFWDVKSYDDCSKSVLVPLSPGTWA